MELEIKIDGKPFTRHPRRIPECAREVVFSFSDGSKTVWHPKRKRAFLKPSPYRANLRLPGGGKVVFLTNKKEPYENKV